MTTCPLCGSPGLAWKPGGFSLRHSGATRLYLDCPRCGSGVCSPMPTPEDLLNLYDSSYELEAGPFDDDEWLGRWLDRVSPGLFVDYGCGSGQALELGARRGWSVVGLELNGEVARLTRERTGHEVVGLAQGLRRFRGQASVVHFGDVIEHLPDPLSRVSEALTLLPPGGLVLARGPLEAGPTLFTRVLRLVRRLRAAPPIEMPPYHVLQATASGQRTFFARLALEEQEFRICEAAWPAPRTLSRVVARKPRQFALYLLRRASQLTSALASRRLGNRYTYSGRKAASAIDPGSHD